MSRATQPLDESRPLPFRPGESPFRVKGVAYRGHLEYVSEHVPGGVDEMLRGFRDPALPGFFAQKFLPSTYYDIIPLIVAGYVCARQSRKSFSEFVRIRSRYQAERDVGGIYRVLLKLISPMHVIERLSALQEQYFDFAAGSVELVGERHALLQRPQLPAMLAGWTATVLETYVDVLLTRAGAKSVLARPRSLLPDGQVRGVAAVKWQCDITWQ